MGEMLVDEGPSIDYGVAIFVMKRPLVVKPVEDCRGRALVGLGEREVPAWSNSSTVPWSAQSGWAQAILQWRKMNVVGWCQRLFHNATPGN